MSSETSSTGTTVTVIPCGAMTADLTWLLWDTSCPRDWEQRWAPTGLQDFFP